MNDDIIKLLDKLQYDYDMTSTKLVDLKKYERHIDSIYKLKYINDLSDTIESYSSTFQDAINAVYAIKDNYSSD